MKRFVLLLLLLTPSPCFAANGPQPLQREDFAYGMELTVSGRSALYSLTLPAEVYKGCTRPDLGDLRIFNAHGPVPHLLRQLQPKQSTQPSSQILPFFPLSESTGTNSKAADLGIAIGSNGAIIAFASNQPEENRQSINAYLLDASALQRRPDWLEFAWTGGQFSASVRIDSSDDLNSWQPLVASAALAELRFGGHNLLRQRIDLRQRASGKYLRLSWPSGKDGISLTEVKAGYANETQAQVRSLLTLSGQPDSTKTSDRVAWLYETEGVFPMDQLNVRLPEQNALAEFAIFSKADEKATWQRRGSLLAWRLTVEGTTFENEALRFAPNTDRFWRLETEANNHLTPALDLGWLPGQLLFLAQGQGPYSLVFGQAGLQPVRSRVAQLIRDAEPLNNGKLVEVAKIGPQKVLAGPAALKVAPTIPWRLWLLWIGLLAGVLAVAAMALKLFREMKQKTPTD